MFLLSYGPDKQFAPSCSSSLKPLLGQILKLGRLERGPTCMLAKARYLLSVKEFFFLFLLRSSNAEQNGWKRKEEDNNKARASSLV